jgi:hypothetical protein
VTEPAAKSRRRLWTAVLALAACHGREEDILTVRGDAAGGDAASSGSLCPSAARTILLLDREGRLSSYDPRTDSVRERASIATSVPRPECPAGSQAAAVSLAMDRQGAAWIASCDGDLIKCDPDSGLCSGGWSSMPLPSSRLHMAWTTEASAHTLVLVVAPAVLPAFPSPPSESTLVRFPSLDRPVATLSGWPALTGTTDRLWGLFPGDPRRGTEPRLAALEIGTGREVEQRDMAGVVLAVVPALLATFGGDFWVFQAFGNLTVVQRVRGSGQPNETTHAIARRIVGVASSTCGP